jgi:uracil phosphoribosyltransferase
LASSEITGLPRISSSHIFILNFGLKKVRMVFNLSQYNSIANEFLMELRNTATQKNRMVFRKNVERLGKIMAYEVSKKLSYQEKAVETPLGVSHINIVDTQPILVTVMRAGLPFFQGFLEFFDHADCGFIGAYRKEGTGDIEINLEYAAMPVVEGRDVIVVDPMLATGKSFVRAIEAISKQGSPVHIHAVALVAVEEGIQYIRDHVSVPLSIWTCAVDDHLNDQFYIVPGLGDAGDLCFGVKN